MLQVYLDEYTFRFNRRRHRTPMAAFQTLLGRQSQRPPSTYDEIPATGPSAFGSAELTGNTQGERAACGDPGR